MTTTIDVRRAETRPRTALPWLDSRHSFSFGRHYDPANTRHGLLVVNNDDVVRAGTGFSTHPHQDMEIVTWVLDGELEHKDSAGHKGLLYPGLAQRMSAGTGIWHSEMNPRADADVHFVQMWVLPDTERVDPGYEQLDVNGDRDRGGLVPIASGQGAMPPSPFASATPSCGAAACALARRCRCPRPAGPTCSWAGARPSWRAPAGSARATPSASPKPAVLASWPIPSRGPRC
jgi:redox-sensitive bicupin YhaK (pirin superfamily)